MTFEQGHCLLCVLSCRTHYMYKLIGEETIIAFPLDLSVSLASLPTALKGQSDQIFFITVE